MKSRIAFGIFLLTILGLFALATTAYASSVQRDVIPVRFFSDGSAVPGSSSTLVRTNSWISFTLHTNGLPAGDAVTIWFVIFNHPEFCTVGVPAFGLRCGAGDFSNPKVQVSIMYAAGHVIGGDGQANYGAHLKIGEFTRQVIFGPGLINPLGADIHLIVHDHGPADPSLMPGEIHTFDICNPTCTDVQFAAHEAA